uniref:Uncharacterized protein n=1 Tax=Plectus sambesii TaxID=2011161 RepID=A0A914WFP4_9BILA
MRQDTASDDGDVYRRKQPAERHSGPTSALRRSFIRQPSPLLPFIPLNSLTAIDHGQVDGVVDVVVVFVVVAARWRVRRRRRVCRRRRAHPAEHVYAAQHGRAAD